MAPRLHRLSRVALALFLAPAAALQVCHDEPAPNLLINPGFENGLNSWQANAGSVTNGVGSDGNPTSYYVMPGSQTIRTAIQRVDNIIPGQQYTFTAEFQPYLDVSASVSFKSCIIGIVGISTGGSSTIVSVARTITKAPASWETISGAWTADGTYIIFELAASCAGSTTSALQLRWDNAVLKGTLPIEVCETLPDPTLTLPVVETDPPATTSSSPEILTTSSALPSSPTTSSAPPEILTTSSALLSLPTTLEIITTSSPPAISSPPVAITTSSVALATTSSSPPATTSGIKACKANNIRRRRYRL